MSTINTSTKAFPVVLPADPVTPEQATTKRYVDAADDAKVNRAGDTLTGPLYLAGDPVAADEAATKGYIDALGRPTAAQVPFTPTGNISSVNTQAAIAEVDSEKVAKAGDTMSGPLGLYSATPVQPQDAAPKVYVDKMGSLEFSFLTTDYYWNADLQLYQLFISHTLGRRPDVSVYLASGVEVVADVTYDTVAVNTLTVSAKFNLAVKVLLT